MPSRRKMFLSRETFEEDCDNVPLVRPGSATGVRPGSAYGGRASPTAMGGDAAYAMPGAAEVAEDAAPPASAANMRMKMMQQRQKMLAKQQRPGTAGGLVMANQGLPTAEAQRPGTGEQPTTPSGGRTSSRRPPTGSFGSTAGTEAGSMHAAVLDLDEDDDDRERGAVAPGASELPASKEEEAKRRSELQRNLLEIGVSPEFDPTDGSPMESRVQFDISTVPPSGWRQFLHGPLPRNASMLQCRIIRDRNGLSNRLHPRYAMETDAGVFLMCAQKQKQNKTPNYAVSMSREDIGKESEAHLGKLRSDLMGLEWVAYSPGQNPCKVEQRMPAAAAIQLVREELAGIQYSSTFWSSAPKGPRRMCVVLPRVQPNGERLSCRTLNPSVEGLLALKSSGRGNVLIDTFQNKSPKWNDQIGAYTLNFNKRVTEASVKNFQLCSSEDPDTVFLQFGRISKDVFNMDFRHPLSPFQAFCICLSSFENKIGCD